MRSIWLTTVGALAACDGDDPVACTELAAFSVTVTLADPYGGAIQDATVTYAADGAAAAPCEAIGDTFGCGVEVDGPITVTASVPGYASVEQTVTIAMDADGCHVVGQAITLELTSVCDDPPPAMMVIVNDPEGDLVDGEGVSWGRVGSDAMPQACSEEPDGRWACAYGVTGALDLFVQPSASAPFGPHAEAVDVAPGVCGPDTVFKTVTLDYLPD